MDSRPALIVEEAGLVPENYISRVVSDSLPSAFDSSEPTIVSFIRRGIYTAYSMKSIHPPLNGTAELRLLEPRSQRKERERERKKVISIFHATSREKRLTDLLLPSFSLPTSYNYDPFDDRLIDAWRSHGFWWFVCVCVCIGNKIWTTCFRTYNRLKGIYLFVKNDTYYTSRNIWSGLYVTVTIIIDYRCYRCFIDIIFFLIYQWYR